MGLMVINRVYSGEEGTFGTLSDFQGIPFALTAELPWKGNVRNISCVPSSLYKCIRVDSPRFGNTFKLLDVPGRAHILFHKGNIPTDDSRGCIIIGEQFEKLNGKPAVVSSSKGFNEFITKLFGMQEFNLQIKNHWSF